MIINYYEGKENDWYFRNKTDKRCVVAFVDGDKAKFIIQIGNKYWGKGIEFRIYLAKNRNVHNCMKYFDAYQVGIADTMLEAKKIIREYSEKNLSDIKTDEYACDVKYLPGDDNSDFYPTPENLAGKMISCVDWRYVETILEPSAGKGDLIESLHRYVKRNEKKVTYDLNNKFMECIDVVEMDYNLRLILRGKNFRLVGQDFLQYRTMKRYDVILMNPPFSKGAAHLIHAIELQQDGGADCMPPECRDYS